MPVPVSELAALANTVRQVRWDTPYRLLASLAGLAALFAGTPLEGARAVTAWLGFSVGANLTEAGRWLLEPARWQVLVTNEIARRLTSGDSGDVRQLWVAEEASNDVR